MKPQLHNRIDLLHQVTRTTAQGLWDMMLIAWQFYGYHWECDNVEREFALNPNNMNNNCFTLCLDNEWLNCVCEGVREAWSGAGRWVDDGGGGGRGGTAGTGK